jgi:transcriptional regulator with XRE-family HTH domain
MDIQKQLFEKLRPLIPKNKTLAEYLADLLYLSNDSIYRRLRGETQVSLQELKTICQHFGLSADTLINLRKENQITCDVGQVGKSSNGFLDFLGGLNMELERLKQYANPMIIYSGKDLPFFYNLMFPKLFAFKYYMWMQVFALNPDYIHKNFEPEIRDPELIAKAKQTSSLFNSIPSIEIWNEENIHSLLLQIDFYKHSKYFSNSGEILSLYDEVDELIDHIEKQAQTGYKFLPGQNPEFQRGNFSMCINKVSLSDNLTWVRSGDRSKTFINYSVLNFISTNDIGFCQEVEKYLDNIIRRSTQISQENIKMRSIYFNQQHQKVQHYRENL